MEKILKLRAIYFIVLTCLVMPTVFGALNYYHDAVLDGSFSGGSVYVWNDAVVTIAGAEMTSLDLLNFSSADFQDGIVSQGVSIWNDSSMSIRDGEVGLFLDLHDASRVDLRGGDVTGWLYAADTSVVRLFADNVEYHANAGRWNGGQLTGFWIADGQAFTIDLLNNLDAQVVTYDHIAIVPEPGTLVLLGLGGLLFRRK